MKIDLSDVKSSYIKQMGYDPDRQTLALAFHGGKVFHYSNVTPEMYAAAQSAASLGSWFHQNLKGKSDSYPHKEFVEEKV